MYSFHLFFISCSLYNTFQPSITFLTLYLPCRVINVCLYNVNCYIICNTLLVPPDLVDNHIFRVAVTIQKKLINFSAFCPSLLNLLLRQSPLLLFPPLFVYFLLLVHFSNHVNCYPRFLGHF